jgi:hypothetical protein
MDSNDFLSRLPFTLKFSGSTVRFLAIPAVFFGFLAIPPRDAGAHEFYCPREPLVCQGIMLTSPKVYLRGRLLFRRRGISRIWPFLHCGGGRSYKKTPFADF